MYDRNSEYIWMEVTTDKYEFPIEIADTCAELARKCGTSQNAIYSAISHAKKDGHKTSFCRVKIERGKEDGRENDEI